MSVIVAQNRQRIYIGMSKLLEHTNVIKHLSIVV